uniref:Odorant-binding protein 73a n=1 Tax=Glossina brevipalpis TaxID=37001 RepID=A0A1A9W7I1_9MUSC
MTDHRLLQNKNKNAALHIIMVRVAKQKTKCLNPPRTARRVENHIKGCQEEVKTKLIQEAFKILKNEVAQAQAPINNHDDDDDGLVYMETLDSVMKNEDNFWPHDTNEGYEEGEEEESVQDNFGYISYQNTPHRRMARLIQRIGRVDDISNGIYHPTLVPFEDKRIAGCLLHCVYAKNNAIDKMGWPTLDGLVDFYSEGVNEHGFFMATLRSVNLCLRAVTNKYHVDRHKLPEKGESCDLAFDVFDCISDQITGYCMDHYKP